MRKPCCDKQDINKGAWSKEEDQKLIDYITKHGEGKWRSLPQAAGTYSETDTHTHTHTQKSKERKRKRQEKVSKYSWNPFFVPFPTLLE